VGAVGDWLLKRLREHLDRLSGATLVAQDEPSAVPSLEQLHNAIQGTASGRADSADTLASLLLAVSRCGDTDLIMRTSQALVAASPRMWLGLDVSARRSIWHVPQWTHAVTRRLAGDAPGSSLDLVLAACHPDGFVREAAVAALSEIDDVAVLPALALRAADWVPQVRSRARAVCQRCLDHTPTEAITFLAPVAYALRARQAGSWLADAVDNLLRDGPLEALITALAADDWRTRRAAYTSGLKSDRLSVDQMLHAATTDSDLPVRIMCAEAAIRAARAIGNRDVPRLLLASRTAAVRAEAVHALGTAGEIAPAIEALSDRSALVRATSQAIARRAGTDTATRYRELLAEQQPPNPSVIAGLGETGAHSDIDLLRPWLAHPSSRGRAETVRALRRRGCVSPQLLLPLLTDEVSSVTRQVTLSLQPQADMLDEHYLRQLLDQSCPLHVRMAAWILLRAHDTWTRISVDLQLVDDPVQAIRSVARADLTNWLTLEAATTYSSPQGQRADELSALLANAEATLGAGETRLLKFHLGLTR
jgi:HEAT repeat protein